MYRAYPVKVFLMRLNRLGETLWSQWDGVNLGDPSYSVITFFTDGNVDLDHEVVRRALASRLQRDGLVDSLGDAYKALDTSIIRHGFYGLLPDDVDMLECSEQGETYYGDLVPEPLEATWVEVPGLG
jgi:hypothetical protein